MSQRKFLTAVALRDLGFCELLDKKKIDHCVSKIQIGALGYVAREVTLMEKYGPAAGLWSVGCVVYEMLCGYKPFEGKTQQDSFYNIHAGRFSFAADAWKGVSEDARRLIRQFLQAEPNKRLSALFALQHNWFTGHYKRGRPMSALPNALRLRISSRNFSGNISGVDHMYRHSVSAVSAGGSSNSLASDSVDAERGVLAATLSIK